MSAGSGALAKQYVEFTSKGLDELQTGLDQIKGNLLLVDAAGKTLADRITSNFVGMASKLTDAKAQAVALQSTLENGAYAKFADQMARTNAELSKLSAQAKIKDVTFELLEFSKSLKDVEQIKLGDKLAGVTGNLDRMKSLAGVRAEIRQLQAELASGAAQKFAVDMANANNQLEKLRQQANVGVAIAAPLSKVDQALQSMRDGAEAVTVRLEAMRKAVASGEYATLTKRMADARNEMEALARSTEKQKGVFSSFISAALSQANALANGMRGAFSSVGNQIVNPVAIGAAVAGFNMLTSAARSWVNAGLAGTTHGNMLSTQFTMLSQQIAGVFVPTINMVIQGIQNLTGWFRSLTGGQQAMIRHFVEAAAVMVLVNQTLGRLTGMVLAFVGTLIGGMVSAGASIVTVLIPAFVKLTAAVTTGSGIMTAALGLATAGISTILGLVAAAVGALASLGIAGATMGAGIAVGTESGRASLARLWETVKRIFEQIKSAGARLWDGISGPLEKLGERVGALLGKFADGFVALLPTIEAVAIKVFSVADWIMNAVVAVGEFVERWVGVKNALLIVAGAVGAIAAVVASVLAPPLLAIGVIIAGLAVTLAPIAAIAAGIGYVFYRVVKAVWPLVEAVMKVGEALGRVVAIIFGPILSAFGSLAGMAGSGVLGLISASFEGWLTILEKVATFMGTTLVYAISGVIDLMRLAAQSIADMIDNLPTAMQNALGVTSAGMRSMAASLRAVHAQMNSATSAGTPGSAAARAGDRNDVQTAGGNFEQAMDLFKRINEAATRNYIPEQQLAVQETMADYLRQLLAKAGVSVTPAGSVAPPGGAIGGGLGWLVNLAGVQISAPGGG